MLMFHVTMFILVACHASCKAAGSPSQLDTPVVRSASNQQRTANELSLQPSALFDYANRGEKQVEQQQSEKISQRNLQAAGEPPLIEKQETRKRVDYGIDESFGKREKDSDKEGFSSPETDQRLKFSYDPDQNKNARRNLFKKPPSAMALIINDNISAKSDSATAPKLSTEQSSNPSIAPRTEVAGRYNGSSPETDGRLKFSSVYSEGKLNEKLCEKKQVFKNELSEYLNEVLNTVKSNVHDEVEPSKSNDQNRHDHENVKETENNDPKATIKVVQRKSDFATQVEKNSEAGQAVGNLHLENQNNHGRKTSVVKANPELAEQRKNETSTAERQLARTLLASPGASVPVAYTLHQQSTNMKPTRTQHLEQNKRSTGEATLVKLPSYGTRGGPPGPNRRQYTAEVSPLSTRGNVQLAALNPIQLEAAAAYHNPAQALRVDPFNSGIENGPSATTRNLPHPLYQFNPVQVNALRGVFDKVPAAQPNFQPIPPKQVAFAPPRLVYETKILPSPFMPFRTEQKTVQALSALLGQSPQQQLQGLNLILSKNHKQIPQDTREEIPISEKQVAYEQAFVTPVTPSDVNSGLSGIPQTFITDDSITEEVDDQSLKNHRPPTTNHKDLPGENELIVKDRNNRYRPITSADTKRIHLEQSVLERDHASTPAAVWEENEYPEVVVDEHEGRYRPQSPWGDGSEEYAGKYMFGYRVTDHESGNDFGHEEKRDGEITNGRYHVLLPDGRVQNVNYHVDRDGYHAKVSYQLDHGR